MSNNLLQGASHGDSSAQIDRKSFSENEPFESNWAIFCEMEDAEYVPEVKAYEGGPDFARPVVVQGKAAYVSQHEEELEEPMGEEETAESLGRCVVEVQYDADNANSVRLISVEGPLVDKKVTKALGMAINSYKNITTLKLIGCSILAVNLDVLAVCMAQGSSIKFLYLDDNIIEEENYGIVLRNNPKHLSLRRCQISDVGVRGLAEQLIYREPVGQHLLSLNLNSNRIDDSAFAPLVEALRWNRTLSALSVAGNRLTNKSFRRLLAVTKAFPLTREEHLVMRKTYMNVFIRNSELVKTEVAPVINKPVFEDRFLVGKESLRKKLETEEKGGKKKQPLPATASLAKRGSKRSTSTKGRNSAYDAGGRRYSNLRDQISLPELPESINPLLNEVTEEGMSAVATGNLALRYINFSCNHITTKGVRFALKTIKEQEDSGNWTRSQGLIRIRLDGNKLAKELDAIERLNEKLMTHCWALYLTRGSAKSSARATPGSESRLSKGNPRRSTQSSKMKILKTANQ